MPFWGSGLSFSGFKIPKILSLSFSGLRKLAQNLSSFQVYRFERKFWPKFGQNASFFGKISYSRELDLIKSQFSGFFVFGSFGFWQSLEIRFFFEFEFGKIAKTRRVFEFSWVWVFWIILKYLRLSTFFKLRVV